MNTVVTKESFSLTPTSLKEAMQYSEMLAKSSVIPKDYQNKPGDILVAVQMGAEIGLKPIQALQNIAVINSRPCVWGDALPGLVRGSGKCERIRETFDERTMTATCTVKRKGEPEESRSFSKVQAEKAGLFGRVYKNGEPSPWAKYPERMLQMRARAYALRDVFADVLGGISMAEEVMDYDDDPVPVDGEVVVNEKKLGVEGLKQTLRMQEDTAPPSSIHTPEVKEAINNPKIEQLKERYQLKVDRINQIKSLIKKLSSVAPAFLSSASYSKFLTPEDLSEDERIKAIEWLENKVQEVTND